MPGTHQGFHPNQKAGGFLDFQISFGSSFVISMKFTSCFFGRVKPEPCVPGMARS